MTDELHNGTVTRAYTYGLFRIDQTQLLDGAWTTHFYGYDGHGSVRQLLDTAGAVTDTYDYDAFGNLINQTGMTPNIYLYAGEAYDSTLGLYYNRARYLDVRSGRFWGMDTYEGQGNDPSSLHKYLYVQNDPVNNFDPSGNETLGSVMHAMGIYVTLTGMVNATIMGIFAYDASQASGHISAWMFSARASENAGGFTGGAGMDFVYIPGSNAIYGGFTLEGGLMPSSRFRRNPTNPGNQGLSFSWAIGPVFGSASADDLSGWSTQAVIPLSVAALLPRALISTNKAWGAMSELAKHSKNIGWRDVTFGFGLSSSGASYFQVGARSNSFSAVAGFSFGLDPVLQWGDVPGLDQAKAIADSFTELEQIGSSSGFISSVLAIH